MIFHRFKCDISAIPQPDRFTFPFCYTPHPLVVKAMEEVCRYINGNTPLENLLNEGKMIGGLVGTNGSETGFLAGYSGVIGHTYDWDYFVPPVYNLLAPDGYFTEEEKNISSINTQIEVMLTTGEYIGLQQEIAQFQQQADESIAAFKKEMADRKARRDALRAAGRESEITPNESNYDKAQLKRIKRQWEERIKPLQDRLGNILQQVEQLKSERKTRSAALQRRLFDSFAMLNARGEVKSLCEIFEAARGELPPAGAGECAAPRLLQYAYKNHLTPIAMGEFWWGKSPKSEIRHHLHFYPACKSKCEPILNHMLQGLDVEPNPLEATESESTLQTVYEDEWLWVVDKPAGMLSVPGKGAKTSVADIARMKYPDATGPLTVHRLDMDTSGLLVIAKTKEVHEALQAQFESKSVEKEYRALLSEDIKNDEGIIELPLAPNIHHRPEQMVDHENGKTAVTRYKVLERNANGTTLVAFYPLTGRTHQLRVHSAHHLGLGAPIVGDRIYGRTAHRLCLHAYRITFTHPITHYRITLQSPTTPHKAFAK